MTEDTSLLTDAEWRLVDRYLSGECGPAERSAMVALMAERPDVAQLARAVTVGTGDPTPPDQRASWAQVMAKLPAVGASHPSSRPYRSITPVRRSVTWHRAGAWLAGAALLAIATFAFRGPFGWRTPSSAASPIHDVAAARGQRVRVALPDGSTVLLAPASRIRYASDFGVRTRQVELDGEALFTVPNSAGVPFIVRTGTLDTRVLGTTFAVRRYADDSNARVVVAEGRVAVAMKGSAAVTLVTGNEIVVAQDGTMARNLNADIGAVLGWTQGTLTFSATPLRDVAADMVRLYGVDVQVTSPALGARLVTGVIRERTRPDTAARMLAAMLGVRAERRGQTIFLTE